MPLIITATDYSDIADKAINYSCRLAADIGASVVVLHSFIIPVTFSDIPMTVMPVMPVSDEMLIAEKSMDDLIGKLKLVHTGIDISGKVVYGDIIDGIEEQTEAQLPWMIVMGNSDAGDSASWFGNAVAKALRTLPYAVLVVPPDAAYKPVKKICFASDYKYGIDVVIANQLTNIVTQLNAELHILNISSDSDQQNETAGNAGVGEKLPEPVEHNINAGLLAAQPQYHLVAGTNVDEAIQKFTEDNNMDWLLIIPHKHSFFEGLFHKSHTEAMVQKSHIPIVALHDK